MYRRTFALALIAGTSLSLASCATGNTALATVAADVTTIANGFAAVLPQLGTIANLSKDKLALVAALVANLQSLAAQVGAAASASAAQPIVAQVEADVNAIVDTLAAMPLLPAPVSVVLQAAAVLLPVIEVAVGMALPVAHARMTALAAKGHMTPDQARAALKAAR